MTTFKERRQGLVALARIYAVEFSYCDSQNAIKELQELRALIQDQHNRPRIIELLSKITSTGKVPVERIPLPGIPKVVPFPAPFHRAEDSNHFINQLTAKYIKLARRTQLTQYIKDNDDVRELLDANFVVLKVNMSPENRNEEFLAQYPRVVAYPFFFVRYHLLHLYTTRQGGKKATP